MSLVDKKLKTRMMASVHSLDYQHNKKKLLVLMYYADMLTVGDPVYVYFFIFVKISVGHFVIYRNK